MPTTLITGLPRSGTTLLCALLSDVPDVVALAEPMPDVICESADAFMTNLTAFIDQTRHQALREGTVPSKTMHGAFTDNTFEQPTMGNQLRKPGAATTLVTLNKPLSSDFHLFIKHPAVFSALVDRLRQYFDIRAIVRHPLAVLASWQTVDMAVYHGRQPVAEAYLPELKARLDATPDRIARQLILLQHLFMSYDVLPDAHVLRYEDLVRQPKCTLQRLTLRAEAPSRPIHHYDLAQRYAGVDLTLLARRLESIAGAYQRFYPD